MCLGSVRTLDGEEGPYAGFERHKNLEFQAKMATFNSVHAGSGSYCKDRGNNKMVFRKVYLTVL